ncbi:helix-turn-helix transcriptional regulator [uncultured Shewanella sp.]|uniref:helix-turn-helix domain-containing protein n=1 Tax=uncultured Shewanella sp. TaxID=173975 RepID=UPI00260354CF|nr:helix-turn-helix transcriptional regulator [uncultured Shewanella sp.]
MQLSTSKLKALRGERSWSQEVLAKSTGLSLRTIQRIESEGKASAESTLALSSAFEVTPGDLISTQAAIDVNFTGRRVMQGDLLLIAIFSTLISLFFLASDALSYFDLPTLVFTYTLTYMLTALSFGFDGLARSITGLRYLFAKELLGGKAAVFLAKLYGCQIRFCYTSAVLIFLIGSIAMLRQASETQQVTDLFLLLESSAPVVVLPFLYAVILCECLIRPLKIKLECEDISTS